MKTIFKKPNSLTDTVFTIAQAVRTELCIDLYVKSLMNLILAAKPLRLSR